MNRRYYAHTLDDAPEDEWQPLEDHLRAVAETAREFAEHFGLGDWAYLAGLWHDLGKYSEDFQRKVLKAGEPISATATGPNTQAG